MNTQLPLPKKIQQQLYSIGFSDTVQSLKLPTVVKNIKDTFADELYNTHLLNLETTKIPPVLHSLLKHNLLKPKTLEQVFESDEFISTIQMIKADQTKNRMQHPWDFPAIARFHGMSVCKQVFMLGIDVQLGDFPDDFGHIQPGHNQYPRKAELFRDTPVIKLQRVRGPDDPQFFGSFDTIYHVNQSSRLFSDIFKGDLNNAERNAADQYARGLPGCWWMVQSTFLKIAGLPLTTSLDKDKTLQVILA